MRIAPVGNHLARHARLRAALADANLSALLVTSLPNISYLTGLFASAANLIVGPDELRLIIDGRYHGAAQDRQRDLPGLALVLVPANGSFEESISTELAALGVRTGFETDHITVRQHGDIVRRLPTGVSEFDLLPIEGMVEGLRAVKDSWELDRLRDGGMRLSDAAKCIIPKALAGISERELAGVIEVELRRAGFDRPAFDTIVASGSHSALPHHRAGDRQLADGDLVVLDFGGTLDGYSVDLSRTVAVGQPGGRERHLYEHVMAAQAAAHVATGPGVSAAAVDAAARRVLETAGLGEAFCHSTGHGLGLEVHERPRVGRPRLGRADEVLQAGMVFTLEPGAYLAGWGGVRIEDDVVVTKGGAEWLTDVPRLL